MGKAVARGTFAIYVDVLLLATLLSVYSPRLTGLTLHEWLGVSLVATLIVHLLLSWSWISAGTRRFADRNARARINYVLKWTQFVLILIELTSGFAISHVALPSVGVRTINDRSWRALHNGTLNWTLLVLGFHVAMNWRPLVVGVGRHVWPRLATDA
jgi:hypothetical protein